MSGAFFEWSAVDEVPVLEAIYELTAIAEL